MVVKGTLHIHWRCPACGNTNKQVIEPLAENVVLRDSLVKVAATCSLCKKHYEVMV